MKSTNNIGMWRHWLERRQPSETVILAGLSSLVGLTAAIGVWLFKQLIEFGKTLFFTDIFLFFSKIGNWTVLFLPIIGGLLVGLLVHFYIGHERHHGVSGIIEAVAMAGGKLRYKRIPLKTLAAILSISSGASVGPEDPSVQIGANLGSMFGQRLHLSEERMRILVASGSAAGISAAFNAPIASVFFAMEIILGEFSGGALSMVLIASVISAVFTQAVSGAQPAFAVPSYGFGPLYELPLYLILGLLAGLTSIVYNKSIYKSREIFSSLHIPEWSKPALAGLLVGVVGIGLPQIFGVGYPAIESILQNNQPTIWILLALLIAKLLLTAVSIGGGFFGGVFAPSLFLGATLGSILASLLNMLFPLLYLKPAAFAMVGMAAVLAGSVHAPLTAVLLLFEMTNDYRIILPLMFAVAVSMIISQRIQRDSVYTLALTQKGIRLDKGRDIEIMETITVGEIMHTESKKLYESDTIPKAMQLFWQTRLSGLPVVDEREKLVGMITVADFEHAKENRDTITVGDLCTRQLAVTFPDETIGTALRRMSLWDVGRLPVVERDNPEKLVGLLRRIDLVRAYDVALRKRAAIHSYANQARLGLISGINVQEFLVEMDAPCEGKQISEIKWPDNCIIASLRRREKVYIPHGKNIIKAGDVLVIVSEDDISLQKIQSLCRTKESNSKEN